MATTNAHRQIVAGLDATDAWGAVTELVFLYCGFAGLIAAWPRHRRFERRLIVALARWASHVLDAAGIGYEPDALVKALTATLRPGLVAMTDLRQPPRIGWTPEIRRHFDLVKAALVLLQYGAACAFRDERSPEYLREAIASAVGRRALTRDYTDVIVTGLRDSAHTGQRSGVGAVTWNTGGVTW